MLEITLADYDHPIHRQAVVQLLNDYTKDPMGGGKALPEATRTNLISEMAKRDHVFSILAFVNGEPVGLANCVEGFSTFAAKPVMNIHDITVVAPFRGQGIARRLLQKVETVARSRGCCKLTLEVLAGNEPAKTVYDKFGFKPYQLDESLGHAEFWQKYI